MKFKIVKNIDKEYRVYRVEKESHILVKMDNGLDLFQLEVML